MENCQRSHARRVVGSKDEGKLYYLTLAKIYECKMATGGYFYQYNQVNPVGEKKRIINRFINRIIR
jgi:hypothetical protein